MIKKRKRNAIHSGIGDNDDLLVKRPIQEEVTEDFQYAARLRGKKRHETMIFPELPFEYGVSYKGQTLETYNEKEYKYDINAHPEKNIAYRIEETKELPVKRLWEAKACFEAEVLRYNMKYAVTYKGHTGIKDKRTAEYAVNWGGEYNVRDMGDAKDLFTDERGNYIGYSDGTTGWRMNDTHVDDPRNRAFFSGVVAKDMYNWDAYQAEFTFKPILNDGAGIFGQTRRYNWSTGTFYSAPCWDDDVIGLIFQAKDAKNFYMMFWEANERIAGSSRAADNLNGINIFTDRDEYVNRSVVSSSASSWSDYCNNKGWGKLHRRVYKVTNGVLSRVNIPDHGNGAGWTMNNMHTLKVITSGANVKIYGGGSLFFDFNTDWDHGSFGMFNVSQSVEFHSIDVIEKKRLYGRIPESGWDSTSEDKTLSQNATTYVKNSDSFKNKINENGISASAVTMTSITGSVRVAANGSISVGGLTGAISVNAADYTTWKDYSGRIPSSGWFEFDGVGEYQLTGNAQDYIRSKSGVSDLLVDTFEGIVEDSKTGKVFTSTKTGPIIARNNNAPDAGKKYSKCYIRCGIVEVDPDHRDYRTGLLVWADIADVFKDDYKEFFNREDYINKKATYELLQPIKKDPPKPPVKEESEAGCFVEDPDVPVPDDPIIDCLNDFDFDGKKLVMWSCEFPVEITTKLFEDKVFAYRGWVTFNPLVSFTPNKWTTYKLIPIEATIDPRYDEIKWAGREDLDKAPVGTKVIIRTKEWYKAIFPADIINTGIVNSEQDKIGDIPPAPEHYWLPTAMNDTDVSNRMPDSFDVIHYLLDAFDNHPDVVMGFKSNPSLTTDTADKRPESLAQEGRNGMPIILTSNENDQIVIHCKPDPRYLPWTSGKYLGYGKVNGKRPFWNNGSGKADMVDVSTEVVFFPSNLVKETLEGPFIDIYDSKFSDYPQVQYRLHNENKLVDFYSSHTDAYIWYTDWYSKWVEAKDMFQAVTNKATQIEQPIDLDPTNPMVSEDYNPDDTTIERIEVTSNNPFVKLWIEEDKGKESGLLGTYYRFPLTSNIFEEHFQVLGDYQEWIQTYEIHSYMTVIEVPIQQTNPKIMTVSVGNNLISQNATNGWTLENGIIILHGTAIRAGMLEIKYNTGGIVSAFTLTKDLGKYIEVYVNGKLLTATDYSFNERVMTINSSQLFLHDWVHIQSYDLNELHDPTKRNYLGEKQYSQLDFQEDVPSSSVNPNYNDQYYEGSFCFNWGYKRPKGMEGLTIAQAYEAMDFNMMSMYKPEQVNFKFNVDMEIVYPVGTPIDITNFTGEWKQWDEDPILATNSGGVLDGPGDWHGPPESGFPEVTNLRNQNYHSGWYNPTHKDLTDYDFKFKVQARQGDDDMYGAIFKFDPATQNFYSFEWDGYWGLTPPANGTGVRGMAIYKMICSNPQDAGIAKLNYTRTQLAHADISWIPNAAEVHEIKVSTIGSKIKVWTDNTLRFDIVDKTNPFLKGAWGPVTVSQPDTYFWDFWMQTYRRVTYHDRSPFRQPYDVNKNRPAIVNDENTNFELELSPTDMATKFEPILQSYCTDTNVLRADVVSIEYYITEEQAEGPIYFKEYQTVRVLELSPSILAPNPLGKTSIQQAVERFANFDPSKKITITQDTYENWTKYKVEDFDVITFTPADCNTNIDIVSDSMEDFIRKFKNASDKVVIFTHDTGSSSNKPRFQKLLREFGFTLTVSEPYTRGTVVTRVDNSFNYPYDLSGDVTIKQTHWNQVHGGTPIYKFTHEPEHAYLSYIDNVYYSEAGDSLYMCDGTFNQQLSDNEMKIWIDLMCRIAQWTPGAQPKMTKFGQSKVVAMIEGQYPAVGNPSEALVPTPPEPQIPAMHPPTELNPNDGFTVTWNGYIFAPESGVYRFRSMVNDGFRLWVSGKELISEWHNTGDPNYFPEYESSIYLEGSKWYPIQANFYENVGQALIRLHWAIPGKDFQRISPDYLTPYLGYKLFAQVKQARPLPWHPMIHNGYYYHEEREHYLYSRKQVLKRTPDVFNEVTISPRPQQGSAIIVRDNQGNNLRKVTFYDDDWNLTLENKEEFNGNGYAKYYLNYKGIDQATVKVKLNGTTLMNTDYIFNPEESSVEFMEDITLKDVLEVRYKLLYSYYLEMNADVVNGFVNKDLAKITLHSNYDPAKMKNMEVIYEVAEDTPFYQASEVVFNPILNHNHVGFLYITENFEHQAKEMAINLSSKTISNSGLEKVLLTVNVTDEYHNPCPNKLVKIYRDGILVNEDFITNEAGEVYFNDQPVVPGNLVSVYQVCCEELIKETLLNYYVSDKPERFYLDIFAQKLSIMAGVNDESIIKVTLRDKNWNLAAAGKAIRIEYRDTHGAHRTETMQTNTFGQIDVSVSGLTEQHGNIMIKVSYDMGFEETANYIHIKVIGG